MPSPQSNNTHLQRPHPSNPHLELALHALHVVELDTFPPAATGWLAPEKKQLLRHADGITAHIVPADVAAEAGEGKTADDGFVGFAGAVAPVVFAVKASVSN